MATIKECTTCSESKEMALFSIASHHKDGYSSQCRDCRNSQQRERYKDPKVKLLVKNRQLKYAFGITLEDYNRMFNEQEGKCKTCKRHQSILSKKLVVDHSHFTGRVRGLLCDYCNRLLGNYENKPELFKSFDEYIMEQE